MGGREEADGFVGGTEQRIRNLIAPKQGLGHSDKDEFKGEKEKAESAKEESTPAVGAEEATVVDYEPRFRC